VTQKNMIFIIIRDGLQLVLRGRRCRSAMVVIQMPPPWDSHGGGQEWWLRVRSLHNLACGGTDRQRRVPIVMCC
jgi:hypothetical protein